MPQYFRYPNIFNIFNTSSRILSATVFKYPSTFSTAFLYSENFSLFVPALLSNMSQTISIFHFQHLTCLVYHIFIIARYFPCFQYFRDAWYSQLTIYSRNRLHYSNLHSKKTVNEISLFFATLSDGV